MLIKLALMEIADIRRARLRLWFANRTLPSEEKSYLSQLMGGKASFGERAARRLERDYGMDPLYLDKPIDETGNTDEVREPTDDEFALVPQLDVSAACGEGRFTDHVVVKGGLAFKRSSLRDFGVPEKSARIIYASGGSMSPGIQDGCVVLLNLADRLPRDGKVYAICTPDGGLVLKRLIFDYHPSIGAQVWIMRSDNPDKISHPDKILPPDDRTAIIGRAVWNDNRL